MSLQGRVLSLLARVDQASWWPPRRSLATQIFNVQRSIDRDQSSLLAFTIRKMAARHWSFDRGNPLR